MSTFNGETRDLLFEVGMAEVPARFLPGMLEQFADRVVRSLDDLAIGHGEATIYGAPRRVAVIVRGVWLRQPDRVQEVRGPSAKAAFAPDGTPTKAATGFAKAQGVDLADLAVREVNGVEYVFAVRREIGRPTVDLLLETLPKVLTAMQFPRNMRWGEYDFTFVRPIRWLLCLLGDHPLRIELPGLPATLAEPVGTSRGHRFLFPEPLHIQSPAGYVDSLRTAAVLVDPAERRSLIARGAAKLAAEVDGEVELSDDLLDELTWLSEHPTPLRGEFDPANLVLPEPVLVTVMRHHQRFAPVRKPAGGALLPYFIGVRDGGREHLTTVRAGYETVLRARLADARFFFAEDRKRRLAERIADLHDLVYQEKLGSVAAKTRRVARIAEAIAAMLGLDQAVQMAVVRAAGLAKCDLVTQIVRELPELQGTMGGEYALLDGEPALVATAIAEQYLPTGEGAPPPATPAGLALAIADKLDALVGHFWAGIRPTGSQDPYGMRRAAQGIVVSLLAQGMDLDLAAAVDVAVGVFRADGFDQFALDAATAEVKALLTSRVQAVLADNGAAFDEIDCVLGATGLGLRPGLLASAATALRQVREAEWFRPVCAAAVRASGLGGTARQALGLGAGEPVPAIDPRIFEAAPESELHAALLATIAAAEPHFAAGQFAAYWQVLGGLQAPVNGFFDGVLVMAKDEEVRRNRLALCHLAHDTFARAGDLSRLVWPGEQPS